RDGLGRAPAHEVLHPLQALRGAEGARAPAGRGDRGGGAGGLRGGRLGKRGGARAGQGGRGLRGNGDGRVEGDEAVVGAVGGVPARGRGRDRSQGREARSVLGEGRRRERLRAERLQEDASGHQAGQHGGAAEPHDGGRRGGRDRGRHVG